MSLSQGQVLNNRYRIAKLIGQGGFGAVYRAWDVSLNQPCALKENLDTSQEAQRQFYREATFLASLRHPNLPRVTDHFLIPGQGQYLVMDFVEGQNLADLLATRGRVLAEAEVLPWLGQVEDALAYLHGQNPPIIHRDIKPQNIIITPKGQAMLVDFGISKIYDPALRTSTGGRAVTPGYSPPEQYSGGSDRTDAASDVYALGATLYTVLTGVPPPDAIDRLAQGVPLPSLAAVRPDLSPGLRQLVDGALILSHTQRPASVGALKKLMSGQSGPPLLPTAKRPAASGPSPRRWVLPASIAAVVLVVAAILGIVLTRDSSGTQPTPTVLARQTSPTPTAGPRTQPTRGGAATAPTTSLGRSNTSQPAPEPTQLPADAPAATAPSQDSGAAPPAADTPAPEALPVPVQPVMAPGGPFVNGAAASLFRLTPAPETRIAVQTPASGWRVIERQSGRIDEKEIWESGSIMTVKGDLSVAEGGSLVISPGVIIKFAPGAGLYVQGALSVAGTAENGVVFTTLADDTYGGDTDNTGDTVLPKPGDWNGIYFDDKSRDDKTAMDHVLLRYAKSAVTLNRAAPTLTNIAVEQNYLNGYALESGTWGTNQWQNVGVPYVLKGDITVDERSTLTIAPGVVVKAAGCGLYVSGALDLRGTETQPVVMTALSDDTYGGDTDGSGDTVAPKPGDWSGVYFNDSTRDDKTIIDYALLRYARFAVTLNRAAPILANIGVELNQLNGYALESGTWTTNQWQNTGLPYVLKGDITVEERSTLTIAPGVVVKAAGSGLYLSGVLDAQGADGQPVVMTSLADDAYGGDTDNSGDTVAPKPGDWSGVYFNDSSRDDKARMDTVLLRYANNAVTLNRAAPTLTNIAVEQNRLNGYALESGTWGTSQWQNTGLPYVLRGDISIDERSTLTIAPGVVVKAAGCGLYISGALDVQGTETQPVVMTALADDSYGGDTDNSGDTVAPKSGDWLGVYFNDSSRDDKSRMERVLLRYASYAVILNRAAPTLTNVAAEQNKLNGYALEPGTWATTQWQNTGLPYVLRGDITVEERSTLTIGPGVVVKAAGSGLYVSGVLDARGTSAQPIVMTSLADDAYGGDTDDNGDSVTPKAGDWNGVYFYKTDNSGKSAMVSVLLRYARPPGYSLADGATPGTFQNVMVEP